MNINILLKTTGTVLLWESILMIPSLLISFYDKSYDTNGFIISIIISGAIGFILKKFKK